VGIDYDIKMGKFVQVGVKSMKFKSVVGKDPLYVFLHLPKCGGTTIKHHLLNSYREEEIECVLNSWEYDIEEIAKRNGYFRCMDQEKKDKLKCLYGMTVWYGLKECFPSRDVRFITVVRKPSSRAVSQYRFNVSRIGQERPFVLDWDDSLEDEMVGRNGEVIEFGEWMEKIVKYPNFIIRYLERLGFRSVDQFYFIGLVEDSERDFEYIYRMCGTKKFLKDYNVTSGKVQIEASDNQCLKFFLSNLEDLDWYYSCMRKRNVFYESGVEFSKISLGKRLWLFYRRIRVWGIRRFPRLVVIVKRLVR